MRFEEEATARLQLCGGSWLGASPQDGEDRFGEAMDVSNLRALALAELSYLAAVTISATTAA